MRGGVEVQNTKPLDHSGSIHKGQGPPAVLSGVSAVNQLPCSTEIGVVIRRLCVAAPTKHTNLNVGLR